MKICGLTGGIGMGKSTAAEFLRQRGLPVVDTDDLARAVVEPGQPALEEIRRTFGADMLGADGRLRRRELAQAVFANAALRHQLEVILHPRIRERWLARVEEWRTAGSTLGVVVIPLLFETKAQSRFHTVLCVACSAASQGRRLLTRGWSAAEIAQRIEAQWPAQAKMAASDYVVWTEGSLQVQAEQWERVLAKL